MRHLPNDLQRKNQLASDWMHRGMDLVNENSEGTLEKAVRCFDEAIALRQTLPLDENHFFRYGLSAGWINRGDAIMRMGKEHSLVEALKSYDEALILLKSLLLKENPLYPRRLAIAWINRGIALQKQEIPQCGWEATKCFCEAIEVLEQPLAKQIPDRSLLLAGPWTNLAGVLVNNNSNREDLNDARCAAYKALALVQDSEQRDLISAEIGLKTRHIICRLAVKDIADEKPLSETEVSEAINAIKEALILIQHWKFEGQGELTKLALDIFRFGCWIYENHQPNFLAEFLTECLAPELFGETILLNEETLNTAQSAIGGALDHFLQRDGFGFIATSRFEPFLSSIQELQKVEERLNQLRLFIASKRSMS